MKGVHPNCDSLKSKKIPFELTNIICVIHGTFQTAVQCYAHFSEIRWSTGRAATSPLYTNSFPKQGFFHTHKSYAAVVAYYLQSIQSFNLYMTSLQTPQPLQSSKWLFTRETSQLSLGHRNSYLANISQPPPKRF